MVFRRGDVVSEQDYDFRLLGSLVTFRTDLDNVRHTRKAGSVWECRFCYSLTSSPEDHWRMLHRGDEDLSMEERWMAEDKLSIER